jgi:hypothetical protein
MVSGRLWLWAQEPGQSPVQLSLGRRLGLTDEDQKDKRVAYSGTVNMMGSGSIFQGDGNIGALNLGRADATCKASEDIRHPARTKFS